MKARTREVVAALEAAADGSRKPGMARVGINVDRALGVSLPDIRRIARRHRSDHTLALDLWRTRVHEARILASMVDDAALVTDGQMEEWVTGFDSWDVCDQVCANLFVHHPRVLAKTREWSRRPEEFVRRAAFSLVAEAAVHRKELPDSQFARLFPMIHRGATDERNAVKKAVNWSLRQIGKRSLDLHALAILEAERLLTLDSRTARWIARDALRELRSDAVVARLSTGRPASRARSSARDGGSAHASSVPSKRSRRR